MLLRLGLRSHDKWGLVSLRVDKHGLVQSTVHVGNYARRQVRVLLLGGLRCLSHLAAHSAASFARVLLLRLIENAVTLGDGQISDLCVRFFHQVVGSEGADELSEDSKESGTDCSKDRDTSGDAPL